jgi:hypothetical protein
MKPSLLLMAVLLVVIPTPGFALGRMRLEGTETSPKGLSIPSSPAQTAREVLHSRPTWKDLPREFINALAEKLASPDRVRDFATLCEKTGMLQNNIVKVAKENSEDAVFALGLVATTLTSYANAMGSENQFVEAKRALEFALLIRPRHLAAWMSMALVAINTNDCKSALEYAGKVLNFRPNPASKDSLEIGEAKMLSDEAQWTEVRSQMTQIRAHCHGKP